MGLQKINLIVGPKDCCFVHSLCVYMDETQKKGFCFIFVVFIPKFGASRWDASRCGLFFTERQSLRDSLSSNCLASPGMRCAVDCFYRTIIRILNPAMALRRTGRCALRTITLPYPPSASQVQQLLNIPSGCSFGNYDIGPNMHPIGMLHKRKIRLILSYAK